jgi:hypothetical protein
MCDGRCNTGSVLRKMVMTFPAAVRVLDSTSSVKEGEFAHGGKEGGKENRMGWCAKVGWIRAESHRMPRSWWERSSVA